MKFNIGDPVMHWSFGFGYVIGIQELELYGKNITYYEISINDLTLWVPDDENIGSRLRSPTSVAGFKNLFSILGAPVEPLPENRQERKVQIVERLKDGKAESLCWAIRALVDYEHIRQLNEADQTIMKRVHKALIGEWVFALSVSSMDAEKELHRILTSGHLNESAQV